MATGVILARKVPAKNEISPKKHVLPKEVIVEKLKTEIFTMRFSRQENKYWIGKRLWQLRTIHGKPGRGTFLADLRELDIPRTSAYRWMAFFDAYRGRRIRSGSGAYDTGGGSQTAFDN